MVSNNYFKVSNEFIDFLPKLSSSAVKIYILFKRMSNEDKNGDEVWPSYTYIEKSTGLSRRIISNAINELIEFGWINEIDKGFNSVNHYHINDASRVNFALLEKRKVGQKSNRSRAKIAPSRAKNAQSRAKSELEVGQKVNSNNTNKTILNNNTKNNTNNNTNNNIENFQNFVEIQEEETFSLESNIEVEEEKKETFYLEPIDPTYAYNEDLPF